MKLSLDLVGKRVAVIKTDGFVKIGNELYILQGAPLADIAAVAGDLIAEGVNRTRQGKVEIAPGYDGEYGTIKLFSSQERTPCT